MPVHPDKYVHRPIPIHPVTMYTSPDQAYTGYTG